MTHFPVTSLWGGGHISISASKYLLLNVSQWSADNGGALRGLTGQDTFEN